MSEAIDTNNMSTPKQRIERAIASLKKDEKKLKNIENLNYSMRLYEIKDLNKPEGA